MDSPEDAPAAAVDKNGFRYVLMRCSSVLLLSLFFVVSVSVTLLLLAVVIGNLSIANPISVPCQCKIVSSSVDLRSSKVCQLGLLNYKAKHVFYPSEKKKFRCRYDYYWASVFKVEYIDHSGQAQVALAEAPNEALPPDCRPTFGSAWLTKDKFKVNETYNCWYTLGISKLNIYHDEFFNCQANNPSTVEMVRRYSILSTRMLMSWLTNKGRGRFWRWEVIAGVLTGFSTSLITITLGGLLFQAKSSIQKLCSGRIPPLAVHTAARIKRGCFLVAYFSFVSWLAIQYGKSLGIPEIFYAR